MEKRLDEKKIALIYPRNREKMVERIKTTLARFEKIYGKKDTMIISVPGRTEVSGNHTDHQGGKVIAASVDIDGICICSARDDMIFNLTSEGYEPISVDLTDLSVIAKDENTSKAILRGVADYYVKNGHAIGGADVYFTSDVPQGSGLSSSAQFGVAMANVHNHLYNGGNVDDVTNAIASRYAENVHFGKPCGLMDQMACSVGGIITIDFLDQNDPKFRKIDFDLNKFGHSLCVTNTGGSHADLTAEYASIPNEMKMVANYFGKDLLSQVDPDEFYSNLDKVFENVPQRAFIRAFHFFEENQRVDEIIKALEADDFDSFLSLEEAGGRSSYMYLQNAYPICDVSQRGLCIAMAVSERILKGSGASRIHGGGMAGTIQAFVRNDMVDTYKEQMEKIFGKDSCTSLLVRPLGAVRLDV